MASLSPESHFKSMGFLCPYYTGRSLEIGIPIEQEMSPNYEKLDLSHNVNQLS